MVGLLSGLFNVTVCVVFPIAIFLIILTRSKNAFPPTLSRLITKY